VWLVGGGVALGHVGLSVSRYHLGGGPYASYNKCYVHL